MHEANRPAIGRLPLSGGVRATVPSGQILDPIPVFVLRVIPWGAVHHGHRHQCLAVCAVVFFDDDLPMRQAVWIGTSLAIGVQPQERTVRALALVDSRWNGGISISWCSNGDRNRSTTRQLVNIRR